PYERRGEVGETLAGPPARGRVGSGEEAYQRRPASLAERLAPLLRQRHGRAEAVRDGPAVRAQAQQEPVLVDPVVRPERLARNPVREQRAAAVRGRPPEPAQ